MKYDNKKMYSIKAYCLSVTTGLDKLLINYNLVNLRYKNSRLQRKLLYKPSLGVFIINHV